MQTAYKILAVLGLAGMVALANHSAVAQTNSRAGYVNLVAVLPERLSLTINPQAIASWNLASSAASGKVVASVTTSWALLPGRAEVVTWAQATDTSPVLLASAMNMDGNPFGDTASYRIPLSNPVLHLKMGEAKLTERARTSSKTTDLPLAIQEVSLPLRPVDPAGGTVKMQIQAVP